MEYLNYGCRRTLEKDLPFWKIIYSDPDTLKNMNSSPLIENYSDFWLYINSVERYVIYETLKDKDDNLIGGFSLYDRKNKESSFGIVIHPLYRGHGLGNVLIDFLCDTARGCGIKTLKADVYSDNKASLSLLERNGFRAMTLLEKHL
jgi:RimJ/RimL family protein N-acetyltransferase